MKKEEQKPVSALKLSIQHSQKQITQTPLAREDSVPKYSASIDQEEFQKIHLQYLAEKLQRKKELEARKRQIFGASSSQEDDVGGSQSDSDGEKRQSNFEEERKFRQSSKLREAKMLAEREQKCNIYFSTKKLKESYSEQSLTFQEQSLVISQRSYFLKQFHKIKIIQGAVVADCSKIKLSCLDQNQIFIAANNRPFKELPLNYYIFAFVIQQKLINMNKKLFKCQLPNLPGIPQSLAKNSYNYGKIYKKSQILGRWEERLIVINREGIYSYKKFNEKHSMFISGSSVKQIWTRFETEEGLLVIKILHSNSTKTEFGLPLTETLDKKSWLYSFYLLAFPQ